MPTPDGKNTLSVIIPVHNSGAVLGNCLSSLTQYKKEIAECILVDDGSTDQTSQLSAEFPNVKVITVERRGGPANARNLGALAAQGDLLLFLDSDVTVSSDTIPKVIQAFQEKPRLDALFGSYDDKPAAQGLVSQYRNLLHFYTHQTSNRKASTFWAGCGVIRKELFIGENGFFDAHYSVPCVEDIELGMRLVQAGAKIESRPDIQVKHYKRWTFRSMLTTDIRWRGIPWTRLILASKHLPDDLNVRLSGRISVALTALGAGLGLAILTQAIEGNFTPILPELLSLLFLLSLIFLINRRFYGFLYAKRGVFFSLACLPLHLVYFLCCAISFVLGAAQHYLPSLSLASERESYPRTTVQSIFRI